MWVSDKLFAAVDVAWSEFAPNIGHYRLAAAKWSHNLHPQILYVSGLPNRLVRRGVVSSYGKTFHHGLCLPNAW
jgi:hypothetical protein